MTTAAAQGPVAMALDVVRPFAESSDARLRGNAVVALTALVDESRTDLTDEATAELVRILCAEPGGVGLDWQRRFAGISINAIGDLDAKRSGLIGSRMLEQVRDSREPAQQMAVARLILTACDHGRRLWPISWRQFRRCANLAGRPGFWQCVWAAFWRLSIAWIVIAVGSEMIDEAVLQAEFEDLTDKAASAATLTAFGLAFVMRLSIPGNLRPPRHVYVRDIVFNAVLFGLFAPFGALAVLPSDHLVWSDDSQLLLSLLGLFVLAAVIAAAVRCMRWVSALTVLEPDGTSHFVRPATALGIATAACVAAAYVGMAADIAAAAFLGIVPAAVTLSLLDIWLEEKGPRTLLPAPARKERRWVLPVLAAVSIIGTYGFAGINLFGPSAEGSLVAVTAVTISPDGEPVPARARLGETIKVHVIKDGDFTIALSDTGAAASVRITDSRRVSVEPHAETWHLAAGNYSACATIAGANWCAAPQPSSLMDHLAWAFGKFERRPAVTLTFSPN
jgi:hypothetical protein